jgi:hypothetical protein
MNGIKFINIAQAGVISDAPKLSNVALNALNFLLSVFGFIAIIGLVVSGIVYLTAGGSEQRIETAKKMTLYSIIGIAVALAAMVIVKQIAGIIN